MHSVVKVGTACLWLFVVHPVDYCGVIYVEEVLKVMGLPRGRRAWDMGAALQAGRRGGRA